MRVTAYLLLAVLLLSGCGSREAASDSGPVPSAQTAPGGSNDLIKEGVAYLNKADLPHAVQSFNRAIAQNPSDPQAYLILAEVYLRLQNYKDAIDVLDHVLKVRPDSGEAYFFLGVCHGLNGDRKAGIENVQKSVLVFQQKKDEENFKKAVVTLQQMMAAENGETPATSPAPAKSIK